MNNYKKAIGIAKIIVLAAVLAVGLQYASAANPNCGTGNWISAPSNPPASNCDGPINTTDSQQIKLGSLFLNTDSTPWTIGLSVFGNSIFNGKVGIGTNSPLQLLDVTSGTSNAARMTISETGDTTDSHYSGVEFRDGGLFKGGLFKDGLNDFSLWNSSSKMMTVMSATGNVGIGTAAPAQKLDVNGNIKTGGIIITNVGSAQSGSVLTLSDTSGNTTWSSGSGIPSGMVASFNLSSCPSGWSEVTTARGRYIVGQGAGSSPPVGSTIGTALTPSENRATGAHTHTYQVDKFWNEPGGGNNSSDAGSLETYTSGLATYGTPAINPPEGTNAPYIVFLTCQKN